MASETEMLRRKPFPDVARRFVVILILAILILLFFTVGAPRKVGPDAKQRPQQVERILLTRYYAEALNFHPFS